MNICVDITVRDGHVECTGAVEWQGSGSKAHYFNCNSVLFDRYCLREYYGRESRGEGRSYGGRGGVGVGVCVVVVVVCACVRA